MIGVGSRPFDVTKADRFQRQKPLSHRNGPGSGSLGVAAVGVRASTAAASFPGAPAHASSSLQARPHPIQKRRGQRIERSARDSFSHCPKGRQIGRDGRVALRRLAE